MVGHEDPELHRTLACVHVVRFLYHGYTSVYPGVVNLILVDLMATAIAAPWALYEKRWIDKKVVEAKEEEWKEAMAYLNRFKTSTNRQFIIAAHVDILDIRQELDGDYLIYLLPDGRCFIILKQPRKQSEFEELLANLRFLRQGRKRM